MQANQQTICNSGAKDYDDYIIVSTLHHYNIVDFVMGFFLLSYLVFDGWLTSLHGVVQELLAWHAS